VLGFSDFFIGLIAGLFGAVVLASVVFALCLVVSICERQQADITRDGSAADPASSSVASEREPEHVQPARVLGAEHHLSSTA
jgi:hypothetical protein